MGMAGRKPSERPVAHRVKPTVDWTEVLNVPYSGETPELPLYRMVLKDGEAVEVPIENRTRDWWNAITKMPHVILWQASDWQFALDTAMVHATATHGSITAMAELRMREKSLGTTVDARRDLRIRYIDPEPEVTLELVPDLSDRRQRLADA